MPKNPAGKRRPGRITSEHEGTRAGTSRRRRRCLLVMPDWRRAVSPEARMPTATEPKRSTADQLRHDIDRGRTGDKASWPNPASVPLGTDEEAAGTPLAPRDGAAARRARRRGPHQPPPDTGPGRPAVLGRLHL